MHKLIIVAIFNVVSCSMVLLTIFYYNVTVIFYGANRLMKARNNNCVSRFFFFFPLIFLFYCIIVPLIFLSWSDLEKGYLLSLFFYLSMISNIIIFIVISVGLCKPKWYQLIIFKALGRKTHKKKNKDSDSDDSDIPLEKK